MSLEGRWSPLNIDTVFDLELDNIYYFSVLFSRQWYFLLDESQTVWREIKDHVWRCGGHGGRHQRGSRNILESALLQVLGQERWVVSWCIYGPDVIIVTTNVSPGAGTLTRDELCDCDHAFPGPSIEHTSATLGNPERVLKTEILQTWRNFPVENWLETSSELFNKVIIRIVCQQNPSSVKS